MLSWAIAAVLLASCGMGLLPDGVESQVQERMNDAAAQAEATRAQAEVELENARAQAQAGLESASKQAAELGDAAAEQLEQTRAQAQAGLEQAGQQVEQVADSIGQATEYQPIEGAKNAIRCTGDRCTVSRSFVDAVKRAPRRLAADFVVTPSFVSVTSTNWRGISLFVVRDGSIPDLLGLQAGDVITKIDEVEIDGPTKLTSLGKKLKDKDKILVSYLRGEQTRTLTLSVVS